MGEIKAGDTLTIAGLYNMDRNPERKWWQVWKPRYVRGGLAIYTVTMKDQTNEAI